MKHISERERELPSSEIGRLLQIARENKDVISLGPGEPDFPAHPEVVAYTKKIANNVNKYSPPVGLHELREAVVKKAREENKIDAGLDNVVVTTGSQEGLLLSMMCALDSTEQLIIPDPGFMGYASCAELVDVTPVGLPLLQKNKFIPNPDDLKKLINEKTGGLVLNTPANPTGSVYSKKVLEEIADIAVEKEIYIFSDEAYEHIIYDKAKHVSIGSFNGMEDYVISLFSISKTYAMCGYRVGFCIGPEDIMKAMAKAHTFTSLAAPTISQVLAVKALSLPKSYTNEMVAEYKRRRNFIVKRLNELGLKTHMPDGAFYAFSDITDFESRSQKFAADLLSKAKVACLPGTEFGVHGEGFVRFSYATGYDRIEKAMDNVEKFLTGKK